MSEASAPRATGTRSAESSPLDVVLGVLGRQWRLIAVAVLIVTAVAVAYSATRPKTYTTSASVLFQSDSDGLDASNAIIDPQRVAATNEELLGLPAVAQAAARELRVSQATVEAAISIESSRESDVVAIEAADGNARRAAQIANAYGRAFIDFRRSGTRRRIDEAIQGAQAALDRLSDSELQTDAASDLRDRINELQTTRSLQTGGADLVSAAPVPSSPSSPNVVRTGILGVVLGALIGAGLATLRERRDSTLKVTDDLEELYGRPLLGEIPRARVLAGGTMLPLHGEAAEAFRILRSNLRYFTVDMRTLLVSSAASGEGKSTVSRRLAETAAAMGDSVVLVETDMHRPSAFTTEGDDVGLSSVLQGGDLDDALADALVETGSGGTRRLVVLPTGPPVANPSELLDGERFGEVLAELQSRFAVVLIDSPPLPLVSDTLPLLGQVDGVLVVAAPGLTTRQGVAECLRLLGLHGGNLLGVVSNFGERSGRGSSFYYRDPRAAVSDSISST